MTDTLVGVKHANVRSISFFNVRDSLYGISFKRSRSNSHKKASSFDESKRYRDILFLLSADACRSIKRSLKRTKTFKLLSRIIEHVLNVFVRLQLIHSLRQKEQRRNEKVFI